MARINLLPWREWERERKRKEFFGNLAGVFVGAGAVTPDAGFPHQLSGHQRGPGGHAERRIRHALREGDPLRRSGRRLHKGY